MQQLITNYYITHRDELLAFASSRLGDSRQAEDIVQDVFLRLLSSDKMITEVTLPALVYTITRNLINDYYRRHTTYEQYEHYIKGVSENCREIYRLHIYGGMKVGEISRELGEGYKSVEHRLGTARKVMREYLRCYASA